MATASGSPHAASQRRSEWDVQLDDKAVGEVGRARQGWLVPTGFLRSDAGGVAFTLHDSEFVHRSPARVQHMKTDGETSKIR
jgi:hypothetical protein